MASDEIISLQESTGLLNQGYLRVGDTERGRVQDYLSKAHKNGYLTDSQYKSRMKLAGAADTAGDLGRMIQDLPKPQKNSIDKSLTGLEAFEKEHPHVFHTVVMLVLTILVGASWIIPGSFSDHLYGGHGFSPILLIPILGTFIGIIFGIINGCYWAES